MEELFSYGTLQDSKVQLETFGRTLQGQKDVLHGYRLSFIEIEDEAVVATSGLTHHPIISHSGNPDDAIEGAVFVLTAAELEQADAYEAEDYQRVKVVLQSGDSAWVYVKAGQPG
jgi:gamma-glutamylcyclotransferase (GGCT)/AIG2-like uncharacterized protein YtfP